MNIEADLAAVAAKLDNVFHVEPEAKAARDKVLIGLGGVRSAADLWELYRTTAIPPGAPLVQITETQRTIYWTIAALGHVLATRPEMLNQFLLDVSQYGLDQLQRGLTR